MSGSIHVVTERQGFFTPKTLAAYLALSERTVRQLLADSAIPSYRIAGSRRIDPRDVDNYLRRCKNGSALTSQIEPARRGLRWPCSGTEGVLPMHPGRNHRRRETPTKRRNPSGDVRWVARYTNRDGRRKTAGTFKLKGPCRTPADGYWSDSTWVGCCAQHAIDAAYERESKPQPVRTDTLGAYAELWPSVHPRSKRTNDENLWRIGVVLAIEIEGIELRHWVMSDVRRRHTLGVQARLLEQGRSAEGATGILRAMSAMTTDAIDDEICESNPWLRLGVRLNDPRVKRAPRPKRVWTMEQMHAFAAAAAQVRSLDRDEPTEVETWRAVYAQPMIRLLSDCGLRLGELPALERSDLRPGWLRVRQTAHESEVQPGTKTTHHKPQDEQWRDVPVPPIDGDVAACDATEDRHAAAVPNTQGQDLARAQLASRHLGARAERHGNRPAAAGVPCQLGVDPGGRGRRSS